MGHVRPGTLPGSKRWRDDYRLLSVLAGVHLRGAGRDLDPLDNPTINAAQNYDALELADEGAVRKRVNRTCGQLGKKFAFNGRDPDDGKRIIENIPWHGYRFDPERVIVRVNC